MRVKISFLWLLSLALVFALASCEGDAGDIGPAGPAGPTGPAGPAGPAGGDLAQNCIDCHGNNQLITAKLFQWEHSTHATGGRYERNSTTCAVCHTSQGFLERAATGAQQTAAAIENPLPQNCYTCHKIHTTYTADDWALTQPNPVTFWVGGETKDLGPSNLCISCHQSRVPSPALPDASTGGTITITNKRYGPHHGAQGMMFTGAGAYRVGTGYENSVHTTAITNGCVTCHMATAQGTASGGHTFNVANESGAINTAGCVACHSDAAALKTKIDDTQAEIAGLLAQLETKLLEKGILNPNDLPYALASSASPLTLTEHQAGALWNYQYVREDQSLGVHNYKLAKKLLQNSIAALN